MQFLNTFTASLGRLWTAVRDRSVVLWHRYRGLATWKQVAIAAVVLGLIVFLFTLGGKDDVATTDQLRTVTLETVGSLSGGNGGVSIIGSVRSVTEADLLAQTGGTVRAVNTSVGAYVGAGTILASLENASEQAQVLQAEGAYESALAARAITNLQTGNTEQELQEARTVARNTYRSAYTTLDVQMKNVDVFFSGPYFAPSLNTGGSGGNINDRKKAINDLMRAWRFDLDNAETTDPAVLLNEAVSTTQTISVFLTDLARHVNSNDSTATAEEKAAFATARASVDSLLSSLSSARDSYNAKVTAAAVASQQTNSSASGTASADASVKSALGALQGAKANFEKTVVRAPISGTVNFLPIRVGDYVTAFTHVATVAQNGALEIVAYVSEDDRARISVGDKVKVENTYGGVVTSISPALDPITKQIEIHVAVASATQGTETLVNGQSVRITLSGTPEVITPVAGPTYLPLTAVKLRGNERLIYTVVDGRLVATPVEIGEVTGDRILITTALNANLEIVTDARGLSEGEAVNVAGD